MADVHDRKTRSYNMSKIKSHDTKPEIIVRKYLHAKGLRYSLQNRKLPGRPDLTFKKYKTVLFVNGCFWHGHTGCKYFKIPKTRTDWWKDKIEATKNRDKNNSNELKRLGWKVLVIWECELKKEKKLKALDDLILAIRKD